MEFMTVTEVAEQLQVAENTVRRWIREGKLEAFKVGRGYRVTKEQFNAFLQATSTKKESD